MRTKLYLAAFIFLFFWGTFASTSWNHSMCHRGHIKNKKKRFLKKTVPRAGEEGFFFFFMCVFLFYLRLDKSYGAKHEPKQQKSCCWSDRHHGAVCTLCPVSKLKTLTWKHEVESRSLSIVSAFTKHNLFSILLCSFSFFKILQFGTYIKSEIVCWAVICFQIVQVVLKRPSETPHCPEWSYKMLFPASSCKINTVYL